MTNLARLVPANLEFAADGTPKSASYDDVYHPPQGGREQTHHVFIDGNTLPQGWQGRRNFTILETGFGLGLNFLTTWQAWRNDTQRCERLHFVSTELHPFRREDLVTLHARWPELAELAGQLQAVWPPLTPGFHHLLLDDGKVTLTLLLGDANETLKQLVGKADAIYLDGFAPQRNPQLWSAELLALLTTHASADATLASWCVAGPVRSALRELGWTVKKKEGYAHKWHMLTARRASTVQEPAAASSMPSSSNAIIIGAGIAGCSMAEALARRGWQITLLEKNSEPALEASGNPAGLLHPMLSKDDNIAARFSRAAYLYSLRLLQRLDDGQLPWQACGILQIAEGENNAALQRACSQGFPADYVSWLDQEQASKLAGLPVSAGGWWFPHGAWVNPPALCRSLLHVSRSHLEICCNCTVASLRHEGGQWHALNAQSQCIASAEHLILTNAHAANTLLPELTLSLRSIRGQLSYLPASALNGLNTALSGVGYAIHTDELSLIGASFVEDDEATALRTSEHAENLAKLGRLLPELSLPAPDLPGRVSFRSATHDRLPLLGNLPQAVLRPQHTFASLPRQPGLHIIAGLGARGLSWGPFAAETLAAQLNSECLPMEQSLLRLLDPARYHLRHIRRS